LLSFGSEEAAKKFVEEAKSLGCVYSGLSADVGAGLAQAPL
jgi:hypothetical protein